MLKHTAKALVCALSLTVAGIVQAADPIVIKFSHVVAEHTPKGQARCCSRNWWRNACRARSRWRST